MPRYGSCNWVQQVQRNHLYLFIQISFECLIIYSINFTIFDYFNYAFNFVIIKFIIFITLDFNFEFLCNLKYSFFLLS